MTDIDGHLPADDIREIVRNQRRDRKRVTKMVVDNGGVRKLKAVTHPDGKVGNRGGRNRPKR